MFLITVCKKALLQRQHPDFLPYREKQCAICICLKLCCLHAFCYLKHDRWFNTLSSFQNRKSHEQIPFSISGQRLSSFFSRKILTWNAERVNQNSGANLRKYFLLLLDSAYLTRAQIILTFLECICVTNQNSNIAQFIWDVMSSVVVESICMCLVGHKYVLTYIYIRIL